MKKTLALKPDNLCVVDTFEGLVQMQRLGMVCERDFYVPDVLGKKLLTAMHLDP